MYSKSKHQNRKHKDIKINPYLLGTKANKLQSQILSKNEAQDGIVTASL